jgi:nucleotide-binding universal stress UspA family protein
MQITRVLFPFDYSQRCRRVAALVKSFIERSGGHLIVINVVADPSAEYPAGLAYLVSPKECDEIVASGMSQLNQYVGKTFPGSGVEAVCKMGDAAKEFVSRAKVANVDLIMIPTQGTGAFRRFLVGSVTAKVLDEVTCPVWTDAHLNEEPAPITFSARKVLCAVSTDEESVRIIRYASEFASLYSGRVSLLHVVPELGPIFKDLEPEAFQRYDADVRQKVTCLRDKAGVDADVCIGEGNISEVVRRAAITSESDLILIGRGHLQHLFGRLRTNTYAIIRDSPCPVLSV